MSHPFINFCSTARIDHWSRPITAGGPGAAATRGLIGVRKRGPLSHALVQRERDMKDAAKTVLAVNVATDRDTAYLLDGEIARVPRALLIPDLVCDGQILVAAANRRRRCGWCEGESVWASKS